MSTAVATIRRRIANPGSALWIVMATTMLSRGWIVAADAPQLSLASVEETASGITAEQREYFERNVRPLLVDHCYECHSQHAKRLEGGLQLDGRQHLLQGGDSGPAIVPGKPDESLVIQAVRHEAFEMPPSGKLPPMAIDTLVEWIRMGAPWPVEEAMAVAAARQAKDWSQLVREHWCWQSIQDPALPQIDDSTWPRNSIDRFILSKLESIDLKPAGEADRRTLLRRLSYDLTGLPPTPDQIQMFLRDKDENAYEKVVDELLRSPHFGEKWARHWLDLVRYAETCGHEFDYPLPYAYRYRDYLIRAWNEDVPYDQMVREHVAGDLLEAPRLHPLEGFNESILGTGFWFLGEAIHSPTDVLQDAADRMDNQIDVFCKTFLGLTVACARCHDHKFDPIPTTDYYALAGILRSSRRQEAMLDPNQKIQGGKDRAQRLHASLVQVWQEQVKIGDGIERQLARQLLDKVPQNDAEAMQVPTHPFFALRAAQSLEATQEIAHWSKQGVESLAGTTLFADFTTPQGANGWYRTGEAFGVPAEHGYCQPLVSSKLARPGLHSGLWGMQLCGVLRSPTFTLRHRNVHLRLDANHAQVRLIVDGYTMDIFNALLFADNTLEDVSTQGQSRWVTMSQDLDHYQGHRAHLEIIDHGAGFAAIEEIRFSDQGPPTEPPHPWNVEALQLLPASAEKIADFYAAELVKAIARWRSGNANRADIDAINGLLELGLFPIPGTPSNASVPLSDSTPEGTSLVPSAADDLVRQMVETDQQIPLPTWGMALTDGDSETSRVYIRGSHRNQGEEVVRRTLTPLGGQEKTFQSAGSGRLELAEHLVSPQNPLTSRVLVNRLWHHLFGRGLVATVDDFGKMGQAPSHPELLDWLAYDFMHRQNWSLKRAIRQIVTSQTYRMSSVTSESPAQIATSDPQNMYLHRAPIRRLSAEALRDTLLQLSQRLDRQMFGPSVPIHINPFMEGRGRPESGPLDGNGRRSIYIQVRRNFLSPLMLAFDMPIPFNSMGRRSRSNVPAQSLILMNDPFVIEQADRWARVLRSDASLANDEARIQHAFEVAFGVPPTPEQMENCLGFLAAVPSAEQGWHELCHVLINLKQFLYLH